MQEMALDMAEITKTRIRKGKKNQKKIITVSHLNSAEPAPARRSGRRGRRAHAQSSLEELRKQKEQHQTLSRDLHSARAALALMLQEVARQRAQMQALEQARAAMQTMQGAYEKKK